MRSRAWWSWIRFSRINYVGSRSRWQWPTTNSLFSIFGISFARVLRPPRHIIVIVIHHSALMRQRHTSVNRRQKPGRQRKNEEKKNAHTNWMTTTVPCELFRSHTPFTRERISIYSSPSGYFLSHPHFTPSTPPSLFLSLFLRRSIFKVNFDVVSLQVSMF